MRKVQSGQKLHIPARAYNAFIDAAVDYQQRTSHLGQKSEPVFRQASIVLVRNDSGVDQNRLAILGIDSPIIDPAANETEFKNRMALSGILPASDTHRGKFVILAEPLLAGKIGRAYAAGVCPVRLDVSDEDHDRYAEIVDGDSSHLAAGLRGSAGILWREGGTGIQWAVVRLGLPIPMHIFPVTLEQTGGSQGSESAAASWTYNVKDIETGDVLESGVDPTASPHKWKRPNIGWMATANFGYAHYQDDGAGGYELALGWINETLGQESC